jgi:hypothetical protein
MTRSHYEALLISAGFEAVKSTAAPFGGPSGGPNDCPNDGGGGLAERLVQTAVLLGLPLSAVPEDAPERHTSPVLCVTGRWPGGETRNSPSCTHTARKELLRRF